MDVKEEMKTIEANLCTGEAKGRNIVVLNRGWIFVGNLTKVDDGYLLTEASNIRRWSSNGFGGLCQSSKDSGATLDPAGTIRIPSRALLFYVPVSEAW